jgi:thioredoxin-dependent peroxiredoxin
MTPDQQNRLLELFAAFSQETLTEAELRELQTVLHADVEARRLWFLHQDLELGLKCLTQVVTATADHSVVGAPVSTRSASADVGPNIHLPTNSVKASRVSWLVRRNRMITAVALLCVSAMVMVSVHILRRPPGADHAVGNMIEISQAGNFTVESPTHGTKFTLPDQNGKVIALHFLLKTECPFCLKLAHDYAQLATSNPNVLHLFLKPDSTDEIRVWARKIRLDGLKNPPVIYRDPDARLAKEFGIPDGYQFHGQTVHYPALVLLASSGKELFRYVGKDNTDRMNPDDFIDRLAMVTDHK